MAVDALWNYPKPFIDCVDVMNLVAFYWDKVDAWFEEDEQVFIGPKDPYTRVDTRETSRRVEVMVNAVKIADSNKAVMLLETGQPHRYYIPQADVQMELLHDTGRTMQSTYKGLANYYNIEVNGETIELAAWSYVAPASEGNRIAGYICFAQGMVNMCVDGVPE